MNNEENEILTDAVQPEASDSVQPDSLGNAEPEVSEETCEPSELTVAEEYKKKLEEAGTAGSDANPAAKKAKTLYIIVISVLVVAVIVLAALLISKYSKKDPAPSSGAVPTAEATTVPTKAPSDATAEAPEEAPTEAPAETPTEEEGVEKVAWSEDIEYNVTVELGDYIGVEAILEYAAVSEEAIDEELKYMASLHATTEEVTDRTDVRQGDILNIDYEGKVDGVAFDGGTAEGASLTIGSGRFIPGFEDALIGQNVGETKDINVTFPTNYSENLAGKDAVFTVTVNSISVEVSPEINDAFIAANSDYDSVEAYREYIRADLLEERRAAAEEQMKNTVISKILENTTFGGGIDQEISDYTAYMKDYYDQAASYLYGTDGVTFFTTAYGYTVEEYEQYMKDEAAYSIKFRHLLKAVAADQQFALTDEEFEQFFNETFIDYYNYSTKEEVYEDYTEEEIQKYVTNNAVLKKAEDFIFDNIVVTENILDAE